MKLLTRKALSRRRLLRGAGASLSLPLLDAMVPAATANAAAAKPARRLGYVFIPMGADLSRWTPRSDDSLAELSPILQSVEPVQNHVTAFTNLELRNAYPGTHATSNSAFLSAARAKHTESSDYYLGTTADQIAAREIGRETPLPSLEVAMDLMETVGQCDNGYACVYQNNLSWSSPTTPLPAEAHPRLVFEKLFGAGGTPSQRRDALRRRSSLLDFVKEDLASLRSELGPADQSRIDDYLASVREVERRIEKAESAIEDQPPRDMERPAGVPNSYAEHARLMFDLQLLAWQSDVTRVITFQLARETSNRTYPEIGVPDPHHPLSHYGNDPAKIERMSKINAFHVSLFSEYLAKLADTPDGNGSLLDHSALLYGSGMGNPNVHDHTNLPILVAGGRAAGIRGNRHLKYPEPVPLANLHLALLDRVGVKLDRFGDSNGMISL